MKLRAQFVPKIE